MNELEKQKNNKWFFIALFLILVVAAICFYLFLFPKFNPKKDNNQESGEENINSFQK